jgi:hypothetical protein
MGDLSRVTSPEQRDHSGRLEVATEPADVGATQNDPERELSLSQTGLLAPLPQFLADHGLDVNGWNVLAEDVQVR